MKHVYVLDSKILGRLKTIESKRDVERGNEKYKNPTLQCNYCREYLQVDQKIYSLSRSSHGKRYHYQCAKFANLI